MSNKVFSLPRTFMPRKTGDIMCSLLGAVGLSLIIIGGLMFTVGLGPLGAIAILAGSPLVWRAARLEWRNLEITRLNRHSIRSLADEVEEFLNDTSLRSQLPPPVVETWHERATLTRVRQPSQTTLEKRLFGYLSRRAKYVTAVVVGAALVGTLFCLYLGHSSAGTAQQPHPQQTTQTTEVRSAVPSYTVLVAH